MSQRYFKVTRQEVYEKTYIIPAADKDDAADILDHLSQRKKWEPVSSEFLRDLHEETIVIEVDKP